MIPQPPRLHLSAEMVDSTGAYLLDTGDVIYMYVGRNVAPSFLESTLGSSSFQLLPEQMVNLLVFLFHYDYVQFSRLAIYFFNIKFELPELETNESERLRNFMIHLQNQRPYPVVLQFVKYVYFKGKKEI